MAEDTEDPRPDVPSVWGLILRLIAVVLVWVGAALMLFPESGGNLWADWFVGGILTGEGVLFSPLVILLFGDFRRARRAAGKLRSAR